MFDQIGIDWGSKRFGIAFGSSETGLIIPYSGPCPAESIWNILSTEIQERGITSAVIGRTTNFKYQDTEITVQIDKFISQFKDKFPTIQLTTVNERGSSKVAQQTTGVKEDINHLAAMEILRLYE